jgi:hypothetical protein
MDMTWELTGLVSREEQEAQERLAVKIVCGLDTYWIAKWVT